MADGRNGPIGLFARRRAAKGFRRDPDNATIQCHVTADVRAKDSNWKVHLA